MATEQNPLLNLEPDKQQQLVDLVESNDIESIADRTGLTRRQVLGIGAMLAGGAATGGYAVSEVVDPAKAQADTGDSDGNVGLPTDRVDVFADGIDSNSLSTGEQNNTIKFASTSDSIDSLTESGYTVVVEKGTHTTNTEIFVPENAELHIPAGATIKQADGANLGEVVRFTGNNASVTGNGTIDGNRTNQSSGDGHGIARRGGPYNNNLVEGVTVVNTRGIGIKIDGGEDHDVRDVIVENAGGTAGIEAIFCDHATLDSCRVRNCDSNGIQSWGGGSDRSDPITNLAVSNCISENNGGGGIFLNATDDFVIEGCLTRGNNDRGINTEACVNGVIDGCVSIQDYLFGIGTDLDTVELTITGCTIKNPQEDTGSGRYDAIDIPTAQSKDIVIVGNEIYGGRDGIFYRAGGGEGLISDNLIRSTDRYGIHLPNGPGGVTVDDNNIRATSDSGIYVPGATEESAFNGNVIRNCGGWGIELAGSTDYNSISHNVLRGNTSGSVTGSGTNSVETGNIS